MKYIGGYSILDLTDANVSAQANACYNQDKPVLVYGANGERYFADTITKDGTNIIINKGGKTITIANDNTITNVGDIQTHLYIMTMSDGDKRASLLINKKLDDYEIEDPSNLTNDDVKFLKSLKDVIVCPTCLVGNDGTGGAYGYACYENSTLYLELDNINGYFDLENPQNDTSSDTLINFEFKQLF